MAVRQRGTASRVGPNAWSARWADETGRRRQKKTNPATGQPFRTKTDALRWVRAEIDRVERLRAGDQLAPERLPTVQQLVDEFLGQYSAEPNTTQTLTFRLKHVTCTFGDVRIDRLTVPNLAGWRKRLPAGSAWHIHKAFRQVLNYAVLAGYLSANVARQIPNPEPKRRELPVFENPAELDAIADALQPAYAAIPIFVSETGLRPEEWIALERKDLELDREAGIGVCHVRRVYTDGQLKPYGKQKDSLRTVGLTRRAVTAIGAMPVRIDTPLVFPGADGGHLDLFNWRRKHWNPAVQAAGLHQDEHGREVKRTPYTLRHTYAAWLIATGRINTYAIAKRMGTSVEQIEKTYGHLLKGSIDTERDALEQWQAEQEEAADAETEAAEDV